MTCPKAFGTSEEKWWVGRWVSDLLCYWTEVTMGWTAEWDLWASETSEDF